MRELIERDEEQDGDRSRACTGHYDDKGNITISSYIVYLVDGDLFITRKKKKKKSINNCT